MGAAGVVKNSHMSLWIVPLGLWKYPRWHRLALALTVGAAVVAIGLADSRPMPEQGPPFRVPALSPAPLSAHGAGPGLATWLVGYASNARRFLLKLVECTQVAGRPDAHSGAGADSRCCHAMASSIGCRLGTKAAAGRRWTHAI